MKKIIHIFSLVSCSLVLTANITSCSTNKISDYTYNQVSLSVYNKVFNNVVNIENKNINNKNNDISINEDFLSSKQGYSFFLSPIEESNSDNTNIPFFNQSIKKIDGYGNVKAYTMNSGYRDIYAQGNIISVDNYRTAFNTKNITDISSFQTSLDSLAEKLNIEPNIITSYDEKTNEYSTKTDSSIFYDFSSVSLSISSKSNSLFYYANFYDGTDNNIDYLKSEDDSSDKLYYFGNEVLNYKNIYNNKSYNEKVSIVSNDAFKMADLKEKTIIDNSINFSLSYETISNTDSDSDNKNCIYIDLNNNESINMSFEEKNVEDQLKYFFNKSGIISDDDNFSKIENNSSLYKKKITEQYTDDPIDPENPDDPIDPIDPENPDDPTPTVPTDFTYRCKLSKSFNSENNNIEYIDIHYTVEDSN